MDLSTVTSYREARTREDLRLQPGETPLGGGTWLFSEPQPGTTGLVDLTTLGWAPHELRGDVLHLSATCTVTQALEAPWGAASALVRRCSEAFLMSFKIQHSATVGGNVCLALPAGAMISLAASLGGDAVVWTPDGGERREPVATFVHGVRRTSLRPGEVLRAVEVPRPRTAPVFRRASLAPLGRSSSVVIGTGDTITVTAATTRPVVLPRGADLAATLAGVDCWYADAHGPADWRRAVTTDLVRQVDEELATMETRGPTP